MSKNSSSEIHKLIVIGSGPAGLTAAIYAARANLEPLLFAGEQWGGQLMNTTDIENFPGFPDGISGPDLMMNMMKQAKRFGTNIEYKNIIEVDFSGEVNIVKTAEAEYKSYAVILAMGSEPRKLGIPGEDEYYGRGVSTCATCDGAFYKDKTVAVIGGGDTAMEEATFLTRFASKVYVIHRREEFRASPIMAERTLNNEKIEVLWNTEVKEVLAKETVEGLKLINNQTNEESELDVDGMFLAIGHIPITGMLREKIDLQDNGYVQKVGDVNTNVEGVFVAGEVQDSTYKQAITTAGDGCKAALVAQRWLEDKGIE